MSLRVNTHHQIYWAPPNENLTNIWTLGRKEKGERMRCTIEMRRICESRSLPVAHFKSSFRLLKIYSRKYLHEEEKNPSNLLSDICIGRSDSPERTGDHVSTTFSLSLGLKPHWMMGNQDSWEKINGERSPCSQRWTRHPSSPWARVWGDSEGTCAGIAPKHFRSNNCCWILGRRQLWSASTSRLFYLFHAVCLYVMMSSVFRS